MTVINMKTVYVAHPLRGDVKENIARASYICRGIARGTANVIPFSPIHAFGFLDVHGCQKQAMEFCFKLLSTVDELWIFGDYEKSEGCLMEIGFAKDHDIPIRFMGVDHDSN